MSNKALKKKNRVHQDKRIIIYNTLDEFRNKAGAMQSQDKAERIKKNLKNLLTEDEYWKITIAHQHFLLGEGSEELYDVCKLIIEKYS